MSEKKNGKNGKNGNGRTPMKVYGDIHVGKFIISSGNDGDGVWVAKTWDGGCGDSVRFTVKEFEDILDWLF